MRAESWKAIRIPESARAWRRWHASIMPDSSTPATVFPSAARAASRTSATSFHPHDSTKTQKNDCGREERIGHLNPVRRRASHSWPRPRDIIFEARPPPASGAAGTAVFRSSAGALSSTPASVGHAGSGRARPPGYGTSESGSVSRGFPNSSRPSSRAWLTPPLVCSLV